MRMLGILVLLLVASACSAPHAIPVSCEGKLVPINAPARVPAVRESEARHTPERTP
jgi:hypothetical protein